MSVLALDLGTKCGWAMLCDQEITSGHINLAHQSDGSVAYKFIQFRDWLTEMHLQHDITEIHYEEVKRHIGTMAAHCYGSFQGVLQMHCFDYNTPLTGYGVGTIKKNLTGNGKAKKPEMIEAASQVMGKTITDDNEADAIGILALAINLSRF